MPWRLALGALLVLLVAGCAQPARVGAPAAAPATAAPTAGPSAVAPGATAPTPLERVATGYLGKNMSNAGMFIAEQRGYFQQQGIEIDLIPFDVGTKMVPSLATNDIQVGGGSAGAGLFNSVSRNIHNKVVADKGSSPPGADWEQILFRKDLYDSGALRTAADLRGRTLAIVGFDASQEVLVTNHLLPEAGLTLDDVHLTEVRFPDMPAALLNRAVDSVVAIEPGATEMVRRGVAARGITSDTVNPNEQISTVMYSEQFAANADLATRWMIAYLKGLRDYNDAFVAGRDRDAVVEVLERVGVISDRALLDQYGLTGLNPNGYVNRRSLQEMHDFYLRKGSIAQAVPLDELVDDRFVTGALRALGSYDSPLYTDPAWQR